MHRETAAETAYLKKRRAELAAALRQKVRAAAERNDGTGICTTCGFEQGGVEPDAEGYTCESCGAPKVYGAEQLTIMGHG